METVNKQCLDKDILFMSGTRMLITAGDGVGKTTLALWMQRQAVKLGLLDTFVYINLDSKSTNQEKLFKELATEEGWEYYTVEHDKTAKQRREAIVQQTKRLDNSNQSVGFIIDNWSRLLSEENSTTASKEALEDITPLLRHKKATVTLIGHLGKDETKGLRGSSDVRSVFGVEYRLQRRIGRKQKVLLTIAKENGFDGDNSMIGNVYVVEKLDNPTKINNLDISLELVRTDNENIITKEGLKMYKDLMSQLLYAQTLLELGKLYGEDSLMKYSTFLRIMGRSGTKLIGGASTILLKFDDSEYLSAGEVVDHAKKNEIIVRSTKTVTGVCYEGSNIPVHNERVVRLMSQKEYDNFIALIPNQFKETEYDIVKLAEEEMVETIIRNTDLATKPKEEVMLEAILPIIGNRALGTTELRSILNKSVTSLPFTTLDIKTKLKATLIYGVNTKMLVVQRVKQSRFYSVGEEALDKLKHQDQ